MATDQTLTLYEWALSALLGVLMLVVGWVRRGDMGRLTELAKATENNAAALDDFENRLSHDYLDKTEIRREITEAVRLGVLEGMGPVTQELARIDERLKKKE